MEVKIIDEVVRIGGLYDKPDKKHQMGSVFDKECLAPTIDTMQGGYREPMIIDEVKRIGNLSDAKSQSRTVYDADGISPTLCSGMDHGNTMPHICESTIVAMRVRNPENPSDRTVGSPTEQRLEPNSQGICNTLTSVQKDNLVMETVRIKQATKEGYIECKVGGVADLLYPTSTTRRGRVQDGGDVCPTITAMENGICRIEKNNNFYLSDKGKKYVCDPKRGMCTDINADVCQTLTAKGQSNWTGSFVSEDIERLEKSATIGSDEPTIIHLKNGETITSNDDLTQYRIRKLTPRECWRLMDFADADFDKAAEVNSNTQLYKQAGNSIVKNVLVAIFGMMLPGKENVYKEI